MIIFPILIIFSVVLYIYYKVAILRSDDGLTREYLNAKSRICLGLFISSFAVNQYLFYQTKLSLLIGIVFLILGFLQINLGIKEVRHYKNEWKRLNNA